MVREQWATITRHSGDDISTRQLLHWPLGSREYGVPHLDHLCYSTPLYHKSVTKTPDQTRGRAAGISRHTDESMIMFSITDRRRL